MRTEFGNPIEFDQGKWWFWDETWSDRYGPYDSHDEAQRQLQLYCDTVLAPAPPAGELPPLPSFPEDAD